MLKLDSRLSRWLLFLLLLIVFTVAAFWLPGRKYRLGMTVEETQGLMSRPYKPLAVARVYPGGPTPMEQEKDVKYIIYVRNEQIVLNFNHYRRLIRIDKWWRRFFPA